jgi:hypothetical protein
MDLMMRREISENLDLGRKIRGKVGSSARPNDCPQIGSEPTRPHARPVNEAMMYVLHTPLRLQKRQRTMLLAIAERMGPRSQPCALSDPALAAATRIPIAEITAVVMSLLRRGLIVIDADPHAALADRYSINLRTFERAGIRGRWPTRRPPSAPSDTDDTRA